MRGNGNMQNMMKQVQKMQKQMQQAAEEMGSMEFEGSAGGGMVSITVNGNKEVTKVALKPEVVDPDDIEMLQDLIIVAINDALRKVEETSNNTMGQFTKGMNLPKGLF